MYVFSFTRSEIEPTESIFLETDPVLEILMIVFHRFETSLVPAPAFHGAARNL